jgi:hypothetical protein
MFLFFNFYVLKQKSTNPEYKFLLIFIILNFAKSDSLLYLNSFVLLAFIYAINFKSIEHENENAK